MQVLRFMKSSPPTPSKPDYSATAIIRRKSALDKGIPEMQLLERTSLATQDPELYAAIADEDRRQRENLELIASENYASRAVRETMASSLTNKIC